MKTRTAFLNDDISFVRDAFETKFRDVDSGEVILISHGTTRSLMQFDSVDTEIETGNTFRLHRTMNIIDSSVVFDLIANRPPRRRDTDRLKGNIYGTRCLNFEFDPEFNVYWPTAWHPDIFMRLATKYANGYTALSTDCLEVTQGKNAILRRLADIVRPNYRADVVVPFVDGYKPFFKAPRWGLKGWCKLMPGFIADYRRVADRLNPGDFIYVGSKEEVYLFGVAKTDRKIYMQGTYTASTKPPLYFTNARLDHRDAREGSFLSDVFECGFVGASLNPMRWHQRKRARSVFLCPQMGRSQNCKYSVFGGQPKLITGNVKEALDHFATTDFYEYADIVEAYAAKIREPHPRMRANGSEGFYF